MKVIYHGQHGPEVTVGNPNHYDPVTLAAGEPVELPDELGHALIAEQPGVFSTTATPQKAAPKEAWAAYVAGLGHDVDGLTKDELIALADTKTEG